MAGEDGMPGDDDEASKKAICSLSKLKAAHAANKADTAKPEVTGKASTALTAAH